MENRVILIQGAMEIETEYLIESLEQREEKEIAGYKFYKGKIAAKEIIVSKTDMGIINGATATIIGITNFSPDIIINQGIAGAHTKDIHVGDIIIGQKSCNINSYSMQPRDEGKGTNPFLWEVIENTQDANEELVSKIQEFLKINSKRKAYTGILGSGDVFNREIDRINWIRSKFGNLSEDMESIATYSICNKLNIPCVGIRIISNNEITKEKLDETQAVELQKIILDFIRRY